jgi:hypothetical protein
VVVEKQKESWNLYRGNAGIRASFMRKWVLAGIAKLLEAESEDGELTYEAFQKLDSRVETLAKRARVPFVDARTPNRLVEATQDLIHRFVRDGDAIWKE